MMHLRLSHILRGTSQALTIPSRLSSYHHHPLPISRKRFTLRIDAPGAIMLEKKIILQSSDGESFEIDHVVADQFQTVKHLMEDDFVDSVIPLPIVTSKILSKVIEYCKKHSGTSLKVGEDGAAANELNNWDAEFIKVDQATLFDLLVAANCLNVKSLLDLTCLKVAEMMKNKSANEVRKMFNIKNDFTPEEEEAEIGKENTCPFN